MFHSVGGSESVRKYWGNFLQDTDLLVFVVDASDPHNLSVAIKEVKTLLGDDRLAGVPILVLANKQVSFKKLWFYYEFRIMLK
jgi:GTPase SAR1 family protein